MGPWQGIYTVIGNCQEEQHKINFDKIQYKQKEVEFFGETYTTQGCKPSDTKVKVITEMANPENLKDLQTFLGMVQYLAKFSPRIAELADPYKI